MDTELSYVDIPIVHVLELGGDEVIGLRDSRGYFQEISSLQEVPLTDWQPVEMFGPSLGLLKPCYATIVINEEQVGTVSIAVVDKRPGCVSIHCTTHALTSSLLRQIPIAALVREATLTSTVRVLSTDTGICGARYVEGGPGFGQLHEDLQEELAKVDEHSRRRVVNESFLKMVAHVYRTGVRLQLPPAKHVQDMLGPTSPANARRWIAAARREGYLGPAPGRGRSGEVLGS